MKESETPSRRKVRTASRGDAKGPNRGGLVRVVGASVIALSALSQEYGSGINFVMPQSLGKYPGVETLVPLAMFTAGIVLIPQVALFTRYASIMPRAGSSHVWLTRTLGPYLGFAVAFLWFIGICGAMGFLAYATGVFVADTLHAAGLASDWPVTKIGHLTIGLASIWTLTALHASGVRHYGYLVYAAGVLVFIAAAVVITIGFWTDPHVAVSQLKHTTGIRITSRASHPSTGAFISVVAFFMFAYGGLTAAVSLGGEAKDTQKTMPRGIIGGWIATLILYTLI
jgi:amino acid transporter